MSRNTHIYYLILTIASFLILSCHKYDTVTSMQQEADASLSVRLSVPDIGVEMKSVSGNPSDPTSWTKWERAVDGRYLYRVTAFLLQESRLVATKDIDLSEMDEPTETVMSFDGNFVHGTYRLMIVANYSAHSAEDGAEGTKNYTGISDFTATVEEILNTSGVIEHFTTTHVSSFMHYMISSQDGICPRIPQPLTLVKEIELHPGANTIEGELLRTYSRLRIAVENQSDEELNIKSLKFNEIVTQTNSYLFPNVGYTSGKSSLNVSHAETITPFMTDNPLVIPSKATSVIFDTYLLESQKQSEEPEYTYTLELGYGESNTYKLKSTSPIYSTSEITKGCYLIYNARRSRYLKYGSSKVESGSTSDLGQLQNGKEIPKEYVWALDNTGLSGNQYYIGTPEILMSGDQTSYYMAQTSTSSVTLNSKFSTNDNFTFNTYTYDRNNYLSIRASASNGNRYLQVGSNGSVSGTGNTGNNTRFYLYPVEYSGVSAHDIALRTIDETSGQAKDVLEIKRNDFINVLVVVSYNKNTGHFTFEVKDWNTGGGDVNFN